MKDIPLRRKIRPAVTTLFLLFFPAFFYYLSPVVPLGGSVEGIVTGSLIVFLVLFFTSIFLGRGFCSYICPAGSIQDHLSRANSRAFPRRYFGWTKYLIWIVWLGMLFFFFRRAGGIQGVRFAFQTVKGLSVSDVNSLVVYFIVVTAFFLLSLIFGRRAACHTVCWMAPFMVLGRKAGFTLNLPSLRVKSQSDACIDCGRCTGGCPMSLDVQNLQKKGAVLSADCILCGECIDVCPKKVLSFSWR